MDRSIKYTKNVAVVLLSGFTVFVAASVILAVLSMITWETMNSALVKAALVFGVLFAANVVIAVLMGMVPKSAPTKK